MTDCGVSILAATEDINRSANAVPVLNSSDEDLHIYCNFYSPKPPYKATLSISPQNFISAVGI
jgi:hypothetical protein